MAIEDIRNQSENDKADTETEMDEFAKWCLADAITNAACCLIVS